jgi:hypothetical protein
MREDPVFTVYFHVDGKKIRDKIKIRTAGQFKALPEVTLDVG